MNESSKTISKILLVFLCLYVFLVGISTLSKSISGLTSPDQLGTGDMAQLKKVVCNKDDYCRDLPSKDYSPEEEEYIDNQIQYRFSCYNFYKALYASFQSISLIRVAQYAKSHSTIDYIFTCLENP